MRTFLATTFGVFLLFVASPGHATVVHAKLWHVVARVPKFIKVAKDLGPASPSQPLTLSVHLRYPNEKAVRAFVDAVNNPQSPSFGAFLTPAQFTQTYEPTGRSYSTVEYDIIQAGGQNPLTFANRKVFVVTMLVAEADALFGTQIDNYQLGSVTYYANATPAVVPGINGFQLIRSVSGFTNFSTTLSQPPLESSMPGYSPAQIQTAYDEPIHANPKLTGSGATIAIATVGDYLDSDLSAFWSAYGVHYTGTLSRVAVAGKARKVRRPGTIFGPETTLDVEQTTSNAPGANVTVYEAGDTQSTTLDQVYEGIVNAPHVDVVTTSFGACEIGADETEIASDNDLFEQAAAQGQTWFAASGDNGSHDCGTNAPPYGYPGYPNPNTVDFPASSPYVAAAGGASLFVNPSGGIAAEKGWSGSGGGVSRYFARPPYQNTVPTLADRTDRNVPDVALDADPSTPYAFYFMG
ncbi:MAG: hypothetical protein JO060_01535, partial [Candidatus Eremiobacteraeota bacterium]|nr:hypothetical protein [Candidatus Eremiobacteraeota bacterium]